MARSKQHRHEKRKAKPKPKHKAKPPAKKPAKGGATARIKATTSSTVPDRDPNQAAPMSQPDPADEPAVFTTGPGEAVAYHYHREDTYADEYAQQDALAAYQTRERAPDITGAGQVVTSGAAGNPT